VPRTARACPECGSDEQTGWSEEAHAQRLDLPDASFDYDDFVKREFGSSNQADKVRPRGIRWLWWVVAAVLLALFAFGFLSRVFR
jgi:hypothetical protein